MRSIKLSVITGVAAVAAALVVASPAQAATATVADWVALDAAFDGASDGDVVVLGADIDATGLTDYLSVPAGVGVTLDLNGHALTLAPVAGPGLHVGETSSLTIDDAVGTGRLDATGSVDLTAPFPYFAGIGTDGTDDMAGTLSIHGGAVTARGSQFAAGIGGARFEGAGSVVMTGGSLTAISGTFASSVGAGYLVSNPTFAGTVSVVGAEEATKLPLAAGAGSADTERSPIAYTTPTAGVVVTGNTTSATPDIGVLTLAFHYRVTFAFADGATPDAAQVVDWGARAQVPTTPVRPGYTFTGWAPATAGASPADTVRAPATFTAQWTPVSVVPPVTTPPAASPATGPASTPAASPHATITVSEVATSGKNTAGLAITGGNVPWIPFAIGILLVAGGTLGLVLRRTRAA